MKLLILYASGDPWNVQTTLRALNHACDFRICPATSVRTSRVTSSSPKSTSTSKRWLWRKRLRNLIAVWAEGRLMFASPVTSSTHTSTLLPDTDNNHRVNSASSLCYDNTLTPGSLLDYEALPNEPLHFECDWRSLGRPDDPHEISTRYLHTPLRLLGSAW